MSSNMLWWHSCVTIFIPGYTLYWQGRSAPFLHHCDPKAWGTDHQSVNTLLDQALLLCTSLKVANASATNIHIKPFLLLWLWYKDSYTTCDSANKEPGHSVHYIIAMLETPWAWWCSLEDNTSRRTSVSLSHACTHTKKNAVPYTACSPQRLSRWVNSHFSSRLWTEWVDI